MVKKIIASLLFLIVLSCIGAFFYLQASYPTLSPMTTVSIYSERFTHPRLKLKQEVFGFLPYWQLDQIPNIQLQNLSHIDYFSLSVGSDGHILKEINGETDPGWLNWNKKEVQNLFIKAKIIETKTSVSITALDNDTIRNLLQYQDNQINLITDIVDLAKKYQLDNINIDFEYFGNPEPGHDIAFTQFSRELKSTLKQENLNTQLTLSIMPLSARNKSIFAFDKLVPIYDRFIGMSYEYYSAGSDIAGPTAPMKGFKEQKYFFDVETTYNDYLKFLPKEKIIMGVPYYGREWAVLEGKKQNSETLSADDPNSYAGVVSYARAKESKDIIKEQCKWDKLAQETWCWYKDKESGTDRQLWIADDTSIRTRYTFAKQKQFAGVAIWTLGYDKQYNNLWDMIKNIFSK